MRMVLKKAVAVFAVGVMLTSICASAAEPRYEIYSRRWPKGKAVMYFENLEESSRNQANYAASDWNKQLTNMFKFMKSSTNTTNEVKYIDRLTGSSEKALAVTHVRYTSKADADGWKHILEAPIDINLEYNWDTNSSTCASGKYHLRSVLRHEYGHVMGIAHSEISSACMYPSIAGGSIKNLTSDDIQAGEAIYGDFARILNECGEQNNIDISEIGEIEEVCILYPEYTPVEFAKNSSNIIVGTVESIEEGYSDGNNVYRKVNVSVSDDLKGNAENTMISIPMFGGVRGETVYMYDGAPTYKVGQEVVLYLNDFNEEGDNWYLPLSYQATLDLNKLAESKAVDKKTIIEQIKKDIEESENIQDISEENTYVGEPVEDILLDEE